jgi:hypothetical protein
MVGGPLGIVGGPTGICGGPCGVPPLTALPRSPLTLFGFRLFTFRVDVFLPPEAISLPL